MDPLPRDLFDELCPSDLVPLRLGDKWAGPIVACLRDGPRRFSELRVPLHRTTAKVLTAHLRRMERDGLVSRSVRDRSVHYALTPLGRGLLEPLDAACAWTADHWDELVDAREAAHQARHLPDHLPDHRADGPGRPAGAEESRAW